MIHLVGERSCSFAYKDYKHYLKLNLQWTNLKPTLSSKLCYAIQFSYRFDCNTTAVILEKLFHFKL